MQWSFGVLLCATVARVGGTLIAYDNFLPDGRSATGFDPTAICWTNASANGDYTGFAPTPIPGSSSDFQVAPPADTVAVLERLTNWNASSAVTWFGCTFHFGVGSNAMCGFGTGRINETNTNALVDGVGFVVGAVVFDNNRMGRNLFAGHLRDTGLNTSGQSGKPLQPGRVTVIVRVAINADQMSLSVSTAAFTSPLPMSNTSFFMSSSFTQQILMPPTRAPAPALLHVMLEKTNISAIALADRIEDLATALNRPSGTTVAPTPTSTVIRASTSSTSTVVSSTGVGTANQNTRPKSSTLIGATATAVQTTTLTTSSHPSATSSVLLSASTSDSSFTVVQPSPSAIVSATAPNPTPLIVGLVIGLGALVAVVVAVAVVVHRRRRQQPATAATPAISLNSNYGSVFNQLP